MNIRGEGSKSVDWMHLPQDSDQCRALVDQVIIMVL